MFTTSKCDFSKKSKDAANIYKYQVETNARAEVRFHHKSVDFLVVTHRQRETGEGAEFRRRGDRKDHIALISLCQ